jgi:small subunit ribosomal protein S20
MAGARRAVSIHEGGTVANSRSARKQIRSSERKRVRNRIVRSAVRTRVARARRSLVVGQTGEVEEELRAAFKALDKAAEKGILHPNNAARRKSRLMRMAARLSTLSGSEQEKAATRSAASGGAKGTTARGGAGGARSTAAAKTGAAAAPAAKVAPAKVAPAKVAPAKVAPAKASSSKTAPAKPGTGAVRGSAASRRTPKTG